MHMQVVRASLHDMPRHVMIRPRRTQNPARPPTRPPPTPLVHHHPPCRQVVHVFVLGPVRAARGCGRLPGPHGRLPHPGAQGGAHLQVSNPGSQPASRCPSGQGGGREGALPFCLRGGRGGNKVPSRRLALAQQPSPVPSYAVWSSVRCLIGPYMCTVRLLGLAWGGGGRAGHGPGHGGEEGGGVRRQPRRDGIGMGGRGGPLCHARLDVWNMHFWPACRPACLPAP